MFHTILFVCSANKQHSKTAEDYFSSKYPELHCISAGTNIKMCEREGTNPLTIAALEESDLIFVMENTHKKEVKKLYKRSVPKITCCFEYSGYLQILSKGID